jgi:Zn-dependent metalloprotease
MKRHDSNPVDGNDCASSTSLCFVVPPHIFDYMSKSAEQQEDRDQANRALAQRAVVHAEREANSLRSRTMIDAGTFALLAPPAVAAVQRKVYTARNTVSVPGTLVRNEGQPASTDIAVDEAYDGSGATWQFYETVFGRNSVDGHGLSLVSTVHYDQKYDNAFWNGNQMIYGDGDASVFGRFTKCLDVIGHELTHGVTQYTAQLAYHNQSGALNESISDVFGSMIKQKSLNQTAATADWLIGEGLLIPKAGVNRTALRSMKAPGTAYNDPTTIGKDPQPADMSHYATLPDTPQGDFGGVHINSGIPNKAFYEAALGFGGNSWDKAGKVWFTVLSGGKLGSTANFSDFRDLTVAAASTLFGTSGADIVTQAWAAVGL